MLSQRLTEWLRRQIRECFEAEFRTVHIVSEDPLRVFARNRDVIERRLRESVAIVGRDVIVGDGVVLWGGKSTECTGIELHDGVRLYEHCRLVVDHLSPSSGIVLEQGVAMNFGCYIDGSGGVRIGQRTILGPNVVIVSSSHPSDAPAHGSGKELGAVSIGRDVWIGANAVILKGITIGDRSVVGAGSIVTRDVAADTIAVGNPARFLRRKD